MITPQLLSYIKIQLQKNISSEEIKKILLANGWQPADVDEAFRTITSASTSAPIITPTSAPAQTVNSDSASTIPLKVEVFRPGQFN